MLLLLFVLFFVFVGFFFSVFFKDSKPRILCQVCSHDIDDKAFLLMFNIDDVTMVPRDYDNHLEKEEEEEENFIVYDDNDSD